MSGEAAGASHERAPVAFDPGAGDPRLPDPAAARGRRGRLGLVRLAPGDDRDQAGGRDPPIRLYVPPGANADSIGRDLQIMGLTPHPLVFRMLARSRGVSSQLKAGDYALQGPLSLEDVLHILVRGDVVHRAITVPEGRTIGGDRQLVAAQGSTPPRSWRRPPTRSRFATSTRWPRTSRATSSRTPTTSRRHPRRRGCWSAG